MDRQAKFIQDEVNGITNTLVSVETVLGNWERNAKKDISPDEIPFYMTTLQASIIGLQGDAQAIRERLDRIEQLLSGNDD